MLPQDPGVWNGRGLGISGIGTTEFPSVVELDVVFRIKWRPQDVGFPQTLTFTLEALDSGERPVCFPMGLYYRTPQPSSGSHALPRGDETGVAASN